jgi:alkanesulfonate monooxygenase SsuD/methylene tetrahydromethanopterin reductase-like flavin-dependent oxidoreductase (luciferase family)
VAEALQREKPSNIGVLLPTREALRANAPHLVTSFAATAEAAGFDSVWAGDSLLARPLYDPIVTLATVAARCNRITIGTAALLVPLRAAVPTAHAIASLDQFSGGRLIIGAGRGFDLPETRREFAAAGVGFEDRTKRFDETIKLWRSLWTTSHEDGIDLKPKPARDGGPPIWVAGYGPAAFRRTGSLADGWLPYPPTPEAYAAGLERVREAAVAAGRDPASIEPALMVTVALGKDRSRTQDELDAYVSEFYGYPLELVSALQACSAGTPDEIVDWLHRYWDAGARSFLVRIASLDRSLEQLEVLATDVLRPLRQARETTLSVQ